MQIAVYFRFVCAAFFDYCYQHFVVLFLMECTGNKEQLFSLFANFLVQPLLCFLLVICRIICFRNSVSGCSYSGTRTQFQLWSK